MSAAKVAWDRAEMGSVGRHDFMRRYSRQHIVREASTGQFTMCGVRIPWAYVCNGDSTRCDRCHRAAERAGLRDEHGERLVESPDLMAALKASLERGR